jgi:hypothetical protein
MLGIIRDVLGICMADTLVRWPLQDDGIFFFLFSGFVSNLLHFILPSMSLYEVLLLCLFGFIRGTGHDREHSLALVLMAKWDTRHDGMRHVPTYREIINTGERNAHILPHKKSDLPA